MAKQHLEQLLKNPIFVHAFHSDETKRRVKVVINCIQSDLTKLKQSDLRGHAADLMKLKEQLQKMVIYAKAKAQPLNALRSAVEAWPMILLLYLGEKESVAKAISVMEPFLQDWRVGTFEDDDPTFSLCDHLLKDFVDLVVNEPAASHVSLGHILRILEPAFASDSRCLLRLRLCLVRRVGLLQQSATTLSASQTSGDPEKLRRILRELQDTTNAIPASLNDSIRFLTPSIFTLSYHIWSQGPSRLGRESFLQALRLLQAWSRFVSDTKREKEVLMSVLDKTLLRDENLLLDRASHLRDVLLNGCNPTSRTNVSEKGILDRLKVAEDDFEWRREGLKALLVLLEMISNSNEMQLWRKQKSIHPLQQAIGLLLEIAESCLYGLCMTEVLEKSESPASPFPHIMYLVKWSVQCSLEVCNDTTRLELPPQLYSLLGQSLESGFHQELENLNYLDEVALALTEQELSAKLKMIELALQYFQPEAPITDDTLESFCRFMLDRMMVTVLPATIAHSNRATSILSSTTCRPYLYCGESPSTQCLIHRNIDSSLLYNEAYYVSQMERMLEPDSNRILSILSLLLKSRAIYDPYQTLSHCLGNSSVASVYEWRSAWMGSGLDTVYEKDGKALFWRRRLLKWFCLYLWRKDTPEIRLKIDESKQIISDAVAELLDLQQMRLEHDVTTKYCDELGTLCSLEVTRGVLKQALMAPVDRHLLESHLSVLTAMFLLIAVSNQPEQIGVLHSILWLLDETRTETDSTECSCHFLAQLCCRHHRRVLRTFTSRMNLEDEDSSLVDENSKMWQSLNTLLDFLDRDTLLALGHRVWEEIRWCRGLSPGATHFLTRVSYRLCEELHHHRLSSLPIKVDEECLDVPLLGLDPIHLSNLVYNEDSKDSMTAWKSARDLADAIILKSGGVLTRHKGNSILTQCSISALFNSLYIHTTQIKGYLSRVYQVWQYIRPLFSKLALRTTDLSLCISGMEFSMLPYAGHFFDVHFHEDVEPVITRYMLEVALQKVPRPDQLQTDLMVKMLRLLTRESAIMSKLQVRAEMACLCSAIVASNRELPSTVQEAAVTHLRNLNEAHPEICSSIFSLLKKAAHGGDEEADMSPDMSADTSTSESVDQVKQLIKLYNPAKDCLDVLETLEPLILEQ